MKILVCKKKKNLVVRKNLCNFATYFRKKKQSNIKRYQEIQRDIQAIYRLADAPCERPGVSVVA